MAEIQFAPTYLGRVETPYQETMLEVAFGMGAKEVAIWSFLDSEIDRLNQEKPEGAPHQAKLFKVQPNLQVERPA